jgi:GNAT superfamily N-acetyltransferase
VSRLELRPASGDADATFAHDLTFANMHGYVARHWGAWDRDVFFANYARSENWVGRRGGERVALVRLRDEPPALVIVDLQVLPAEQNKGHGRALLADLAAMARGRGRDRLRLRVFDENPARRLYQRAGFVEVERDGGAAWMEQPLAVVG